MARSLGSASSLLLLLLSGCGSPPAPAPAETPAPAPAAPPARAVDPVQLEMRNVDFHADDGIVLHVRYLRGEMIPRIAGQPPVFDTPDSYTIEVFRADVGIGLASLSALMNRRVFGYDGAPLKDLDVEVDEGRLKLEGKMHKGVWMPFSMKASASPASDGRLRLHMESVRALGIPATKLLDLFGLQLDELVNIKKRHGVEISDDDVLIAAGQVLPPPEIRGRITRVAVTPTELQQEYGPRDGQQIQPLTPPDPQARNYVYFGKSVIRFGKLTMNDADLQLIDNDDRDVFDFYPARYNDQLVAGYSKNTPERGLKTYMPDYNDLRKSK